MKELNEMEFVEGKDFSDIDYSENTIISNRENEENIEISGVMSTVIPKDSVKHFHTLAHCLRRFLLFTDIDELVLVHDDPWDGIMDFHKKIFNQTKEEGDNFSSIIHSETQGISRGWNSGLKFAKGDLLFLMSADFCLHTRNGDKILKNYFEEDSDIGWIGINQLNQPPKFSSYASMIRKEALKEVNYLSTWPTKCDFDDQDLALKLTREGYKVFSTEKVSCYHLAYPHKGICDLVHDKSEEMFRDNQEKFIDRWGEQNLNYISKLSNVEDVIR